MLFSLLEILTAGRAPLLFSHTLSTLNEAGPTDTEGTR